MTDETFTKDPEAVLDYTFDWSAWLQVGEAITAHEVTAPDGLTVDSSSADSTAVTAWLSGGTAARNYPVSCKITTSDGRTDVRRIIIFCQKR